MAELTAELLVERFAEIGRVYEARWPHRPDGWMLAGGLDLTVGDLRAAIMLSDKRDRDRRAQAAPAAA